VKTICLPCTEVSRCWVVWNTFARRRIVNLLFAQLSTLQSSNEFLPGSA
jgi:hypothetical protein